MTNFNFVTKFFVAKFMTNSTLVTKFVMNINFITNFARIPLFSKKIYGEFHFSRKNLQ